MYTYSMSTSHPLNLIQQASILAFSPFCAQAECPGNSSPGKAFRSRFLVS